MPAAATPSPTTGAATPAAALEETLERRVHLLAAVLTIGGCLPYLALLLLRPPTPGAVAMLGVAAFGLCAALGSLLWVRRTHRYATANALMCWSVFIALSALMVAQGGAGGTAVWWLPLGPLFALQGGAVRSGVAMAVLLVIELIAVQALRLHGALPPPMLPPLGETQRFLAVTIPAACAVTVVGLGVQWRRGLLRELDRALVAARAAGQVRSRFIATMSHEIRTPLNGIVGAAEVLRNSSLDEAQRKALQVLRHSADALMTLVNDVLDFSRLEAGRVAAERVAFALHDVVHDAVELFAAQAATKGVELSAHVLHDVPARAIGDPARLRQILHNLVANAVKFTASGEVHLRAVVDIGADGSPWLRASIRDTGIGLTEDQRSRLFEAFEPGDATTTRRFAGSGLGLAISRELAELLGGRIEVQSEPGRGSTFTLLLPLKLPDTPAARPAGAAPPTPVLAGRRIWLVSPLPSLREALGEVIALAEGTFEAFATLPSPATLAQARGLGVRAVLADDQALAAAGLDAVAWAAQLETAGLPGALLFGLAARPRGLPPGLTPLYKPARPAQVLDALQRALAPATVEDGGADLTPAPAGATTDPGTPFAAAGAAGAHARRVLLVEDHPVNQIVARTMLEALGARVVVAANGIEAIRYFTQSADAVEFEMILMDCQMPELDGMACTRRLREIEAREARRRTPIVAMTADSEAEVGAECIAAGMDGFLAKPVRLEHLKRVIERWAPARVG